MNYFIEFDLLYIPDDISKHTHTGVAPRESFKVPSGTHRANQWKSIGKYNEKQEGM